MPARVQHLGALASLVGEQGPCGSCASSARASESSTALLSESLGTSGASAWSPLAPHREQDAGLAPLDECRYVLAPRLEGGALFVGVVVPLIDADDTGA